MIHSVFFQRHPPLAGKTNKHMHPENIHTKPNIHTMIQRRIKNTNTKTKWIGRHSHYYTNKEKQSTHNDYIYINTQKKTHTDTNTK